MAALGPVLAAHADELPPLEVASPPGALGMRPTLGLPIIRRWMCSWCADGRRGGSEGLHCPWCGTPRTGAVIQDSEPA